MTEVTIKITKAAHWDLLKHFLMKFNIGFELNNVQKENTQNNTLAAAELADVSSSSQVQNNDLIPVDLFQQVFKPIRETVSLEDLVREQNYTHFDREGFDEIIAKLAIQDPIEELLAYN